MSSPRLRTPILIVLAISAMAAFRTPEGAATANALPGDERTIVHVLNRMGFGPRPGDVEKIRAVGLQTYIDQQLRPEKIADPGMGDRLKELSTLRLSSREIADQ